MSVAQGFPVSYPPGRRRVNLVGGVVAAALAGCTAIALVWFVFANVLIGGSFAEWSFAVWEDVVAGLVAAAGLVVPAGFLLARRVWAAWTLFGLSLLYVVVAVLVPMPPGTSFGAHLHFVLGFQHSNGISIGLAMVFGALTAVAAVIAAVVRTPRR